MLGLALRCLAGPGEGLPGAAMPGDAGQSKVRQGWAGRGAAGQGQARQGAARCRKHEELDSCITEVIHGYTISRTSK